MKSILIIAFSNLKHDARVNRQVAFLKGEYKLTVACYDAEDSPDFSLIKLPRVRLTIFKKLFSAFLLYTRFYKRAYKLLYPYAAMEALNKNQFDLILANDIEALPLAFQLKKQSKILFDAHEYAPRHFEEKLWWRIFFQGFNIALCKEFIPQVDAMITVNHGLANEYEKEFGVRATVVTNANYYSDLKPSPLHSNTIRLVHHGAANPSRKHELMIEMMNYLDDRFTLDLILLSPTTANKKTRDYLGFLKSLAAGNPRVKILPPVKSHEVVDFIHQYDIGLCFIPHVNFNYSHALPNKIFDYVQARLGLAIGPTDEMTLLVKSYDTGVVSDNFEPENLAKYLNELTLEKVAYYKQQSDKAAKELSAEKNRDILQGIIRSLLGE